MDRPPLRTYGRIKTRTLKPRQAVLIDELLPRLGVPDGPFDPRALMPRASEVWLEIGFGGGEHLATQAERRPDALMIGVEPFLNGVASALRHIDERGLANVRIVQGDARDIVGRLATRFIGDVFPLHRVGSGLPLHRGIRNAARRHLVDGNPAASVHPSNRAGVRRRGAGWSSVSGVSVVATALRIVDRPFRFVDQNIMRFLAGPELRGIRL